MGKIFDKVLLASDFDGTLADSKGEISSCVREAVHFFMENGGRFTVCTGRTRQGFHMWSPELINAPVLLANGGMAYDYASEKVIFMDGIGDEGMEPLRAVRDAFPNVSIEMYPDGYSYAIHLSEKSLRHFTSQSLPFEEIEDPSEAPRPWVKAMLSGSPKEIADAQVLLRKCFLQIRFLPTRGGFLEILKKGVDKGVALLKLADKLGVNYRDVYAVGDGYNDVEMLRTASKGFVPANGDAFARACADVIVRSNDEGAVAHVIEKLYGEYSIRS